MSAVRRKAEVRALSKARLSLHSSAATLVAASVERALRHLLAAGSDLDVSVGHYVPKDGNICLRAEVGEEDGRGHGHSGGSGCEQGVLGVLVAQKGQAPVGCWRDAHGDDLLGSIEEATGERPQGLHWRNGRREGRTCGAARVILEGGAS